MNGKQMFIDCSAANGLFRNNKEYILEEWSKRARQEGLNEYEAEFVIIRKRRLIFFEYQPSFLMEQ